LPDAVNLVPPDGIPLPASPVCMGLLDLIPLPVSSSLANDVQPNNSIKNESASSTANTLRTERNTSDKQIMSPSVKSSLHATASSDTSAAVLAKTTLGTITVHLKGKIGSRLSKSSVFDLTDENAKEVNRKLARLRKFKRSKKTKDTTEPVACDSSLSTAEKRILEWKEELLQEQGQRRSRLVVPEASNAGKYAQKGSEDSTEIVTHRRISESNSVKIATPSVDVASADSGVDAPSQNASVRDDATVSILLQSFVKVKSKDDRTELDWPVEMVKHTTITPKVMFCSNPLYFSFKHLNGNVDSKSADILEAQKLHGAKRKQTDQGVHTKHEKHRKKSTLGASDSKSTQGKRSKSKSGSTDVKQEKCKDKLDIQGVKVTAEHATGKNSIGKGDSKKVEIGQEASVAKVKSKHQRVEKIDKRRLSESVCNNSTDTQKVAVATVGGSESSEIDKSVKDTAKSKWDTSSESEVELTPRKTNSSLKKLNQQSSRPLVGCALSTGSSSGKQDSKTDKKHRDNSSAERDTSSERGSRRRDRSHHHSDEDSNSSFSSSYSRYSSRSSVSRSRSRSSHYHRRRRRRSSVYSNSDSDNHYRHSSRSYSRSRSRSHRRRRTRSSSLSYSSRSSSRSYSGHRRGSRSRSHWRESSHKRASPVWRAKQTSNAGGVIKAKVPSVQTISRSVEKPQINSLVIGSMDETLEKPTVLEASKELSTEKSLNNQQSVGKSSSIVADDLTGIPTPEEHMRSIPLPNRPQASSEVGPSFIGPVLPTSHPLAHTQQIPLPPTEKFQHIGPNDPLVFRSNPPLPPAISAADGLSSGRPPSPPGDDCIDMEDDIAGDEDPIPQMIDVGSLQPAMILPPEQLEQYLALQRQAEHHARRQQILQETGMDIEDMENNNDVDEVSDEQQMLQQHQQALLERLIIEQSQQTMMPAATPVIHIPQQHLLAAQSPMTMMVATSSGQFMVATSTGQFVQMPMVQGSSAGGGMVNMGGTSLVIPQAGAPIMLAASPAAAAAAAFARAQDEAEAAELEAHKQMQAARLAAVAAAQRQTEWVQVIQMPNGQLAMASASAPHHTGPQFIRGGTPTLLRSAGIPVHTMQMHHNMGISPQQQQQTLVQLPGNGGMVSLQTAAMMGGLQMVAQQSQPAQYLVGPNGTLLRLIR